jgi:hypothetical protein
MVAVAAQGPIRADAVPAAAAGADAAGKAAREDETREYKSDVRKLEELFKKLNPSAAEFVPLSRRQSQGQGDGGGNGNGAAHRRLSADAPVFVSPATIDYYAPHHPFQHHHHHHLPQQQQMHVLQLVGGGGGGRDSSSDGSTNGQPNRRVISLAQLPIRARRDSFPLL